MGYNNWRLDSTARKECVRMIIIGADIVPTLSNINDFENGEINQILDDKLLSIMDDADYSRSRWNCERLYQRRNQYLGTESTI